MHDPWDHPLPGKPAEPRRPPTLMEDARALLAQMISRSTGESYDDADYIRRRERLVKALGPKQLPDIVQQSRDLGQLWSLVCKPRFNQYHERRKFLRGEFEPLFASLELGPSPVDEAAETLIQNIDSERIERTWRKAMERRHADPEGAITMARTLLEDVCKHVLDDLGVEYEHNIDLPPLYKLTSKNLNLAPEQHQEQLFKTILSGAHNVVTGLGALRNSLSDSHGKGRRQVSRVAPRHAQLAVNLAGSMASFLHTTLKEGPRVPARAAPQPARAAPRQPQSPAKK